MRIAFGLFTFVLLIAGGLLVQRVQIFPWVLDRDSAMAFGVMFLGAAAYFIYGLVEPVWSNAKGQLIGFLAYDAVLLVPYLQALAVDGRATSGSGSRSISRRW